MSEQRREVVCVCQSCGRKVSPRAGPAECANKDCEWFRKPLVEPNGPRPVVMVPLSDLEAAERRVEELTRPGDKMQSEASRMAAWVLAQSDVPYEVHMGALEAQYAIDQWTAARSCKGTGKRAEEPARG